MERRDQFLVHMYDQLFNNINRHIMVVWQSISLVFGAFAGFALVERGFIPLDYAACVIFAFAAWFLAHVEDGSYWYNRNIVIIANIERQFLQPSDLRGIHFYFGKHKDNRMIDHFQIQRSFGIAIAILILLYHFIERFLTPWQSGAFELEFTMLLPYVFSISASGLVYWLHRKNHQKFRELLVKSPGIDVGETGIAP